MSDTDRDPSPLSLGFVEALYTDYLRDPARVEPEWRDYFERMRQGNGAPPPGPSFRRHGLFNPPSAARADCGYEVGLAVLQHRVDQLIRNYRVRGHILAEIDPLGPPRHRPPELDPAYYRLTEADLDRPFYSESMIGVGRTTSLRQIVARLHNTYCRSIGVQFMHIDDLSVREWLQRRMEIVENRIGLSREQQLRILTRLTDAVVFEEFIQKKFIGAKSFSLEGSESLLPLLDLAFERAGEHEVDEIVIGMAHRGRLNVLVNVMGKPAAEIFREFGDTDPELHMGRGDVKYHKGFSSTHTTGSGHVMHLSLCFNPSHLEFVNPVAMGRMRAKQDRARDSSRVRGMVLLVHGDASFAGEGVVAETLNLSQLPAYGTGGTLHVVVNNQIGFTTTSEQARSSTYATDVAKMLQIPIFHVNGENPEAVAQAVELALDFRATFQRDVVIDMLAYRRRGHNEGDEPAFTQPLLYKKIAERPSVREGYLEHLLQLGEVTREEADRIADESRERLEGLLGEARGEDYTPPARHANGGIWSGYVGGPPSNAEPVVTGVPEDRLSGLLAVQARLPDDFHAHPKLMRWLEMRREMARGQRPLDWSAAESLAFATLACEGHPVRMTGQDSERGTFSHRHAVLHDYEDGHRHAPLRRLCDGQAPVDIHNSPLSETAVLGFEYGYSLDCPDGLVLWEGQFGDFVNVAQVIIDQFIASAEDKWHRLSGLVMLLPHGFEGQGPEHASARLERFLVLAAEDNIQVVNLTTPAQYFHCLRRQVVSRWRKPLVVMSPKSLLRHPKAVSALSELAEGTFRGVLPDRTDGGELTRVLLCSGKVYYELAREREDLGRRDVSIVRMEQLYPLPEDELREALAGYPDGTPVYWVQEEPENMGAWRTIQANLGPRVFGRLPLSGVCRPPSASPATGSKSAHVLEEKELLLRAFGG